MRQKSNDNIPEDEMFLAKLIQTVKARGLSKVHGPMHLRDRGRLVAVCALGAADLEKDTRDDVLAMRLATGFEGWGEPPEPPYGYHVGVTFNDAIDEELREPGR